MDLEALAADAVLELVGRALGDHAAAVDHGDEVGQAVGLVEVLRGQQHRRALGHQPFDRRPHLQAAARVQAGRGLVEEEHRRAGDERRRQVQAPAHAAGVGLHGAIGRLHEVEALEQLLPAPLGRRAALAVQAPDHDQVLEAGEVLVDGRVLPGEADAAAQLDGVADDVEARDAAPCRRRACSSVVRTRTAVVLPAPLGPRSPSTLPGGDLQVDAVEGPDVAEGLHQAGHADRRLARVRAVHGRPTIGRI